MDMDAEAQCLPGWAQPTATVYLALAVLAAVAVAPGRPVRRRHRPEHVRPPMYAMIAIILVLAIAVPVAFE